MKCALHIHTNLSDGEHSPEEMIRAYQEKGFGCVAITDHQFMFNEKKYLDYIYNLKTDVMVLTGIELDYELWNYQHLIKIWTKEEVLHILCHPRAYLLNCEEVVKRIEEAPIKIDAIEVTHRGFYTPEYDVNQITIPKVATDDAHSFYDIARGWIETDEFKDPNLLIRSIKAGEFLLKLA